MSDDKRFEGHTPGPWICRSVPSAGLQIFANLPIKHDLKEPWQNIWDATSPSAMVAYARWIQFEPEWWTRMQEANGELIAAAPDLLEQRNAALAALRDIASQRLTTEPDNDGCIGLGDWEYAYDECVKVARKVVESEVKSK